jgi:hypothetical protein
MSRSYLIMDVKACVVAGTALVNTVVANNLPATFWSIGRFMINDMLVSQSGNIAQDDTAFRRILESNTKRHDTDYTMWGSLVQRDAAWGTKLRHKLKWRPEILMNSSMIVPENTKCQLTLSVHPNLHTVASSPAFVTGANAAPDGTLRFYDIYFSAYYVKVSTPIPRQVMMPSYSVQSAYQTINGTNSCNLQYQVPKETFKLIVALQSSVATVQGGLTSTTFASGGAFAADATQNSESLKLQTMSLRYANNVYPASPYSIVESGSQCGSIEPYLDFLAGSSAYEDPSGGESYLTWADPTGAADTGLGRLFVFSIIKPTNDNSTTVELSMTFNAAIANTNVWVFSVAQKAIAIQYGENKQIERVEAIPYSD